MIENADRTGLSDTGKRSKANEYTNDMDEGKDGLGSFNGPKTEQQDLSRKGRRSKGDEI